VFVFFRRIDKGDAGRMRVGVLPVLSGLALAVVLVLAIVNFPLLTGAGVGVSYALTALLPIFAVAGVLAAKKLKLRDRDAFERLGRSRV
jgi:hypothetical protein